MELPRSHSKLFDWLFIVTFGWQVAGVFLDGWAHTHLNAALETFFTPWHAVLYSGFLANLILLVALRIRGKMPHEYKISFYGALLFIASAIGDLLWHQLFGIESGIDALLSPTHLLLAISGAIMTGAALHTVWRRHPSENSRNPWLVVISFSYVFMTILFMLQFLNPFNFPWLAQSFHTAFPLGLDQAGGLGVANAIVYTLVLMGMVCSVLNNFKFPFGGFTLILGLSTLATTLMHGQYGFFVGTMLVAGLVIDILYSSLQNSLHKRNVVRLLGFAIPVIIFSCYTVSIFLFDALWWSVHLITGTIVIAGLAGYLLTFVYRPPYHDQST